MKKDYCIACFSIVLFALISVSSSAQDEPRVRNVNNNPERPLEERGFKKENLFTGGNVTAGFSTGYSAVGMSPVLGYKFNDYFDGGVVVNFLYQSQREYYTSDKVRQTTFGPGVFTRAYPIPFLFLQAQFEQNFIRTKQYSNGVWTKYRPQDLQAIDPTYHPNPQSLLLGAGYAGGRTKGGTSFYYISLLFDVLKQNGSPYVDNDYNGNLALRPVINAGFNIGLFQKKYRDYE